MELNIEGVALMGSRAKNQAHEHSDYDLLVLSNSTRTLHIEDVMLNGHKVQLFILPLKCIDTFLVLNTVAGTGTLASTFDPIDIFQGVSIFARIKSNLNTNLQTMGKMEIESVNRNVNRLRNRVSNLVKDLNNTTNADEDSYTGAELFKAAGQFLLAKKSPFFMRIGKHLHKELIKFYPKHTVKELTEAYSRSVVKGDYSDFSTYCKDIVLDGHLLRFSSSSNSCFELKASLGCHIVFINSYSRKITTLMYSILKNNRPQLILNQERDLLHVGVYFIVDIKDFSDFLVDFKNLSLSRSESNSITLNYQLDYFLLQRFKKYDHDGLLVNLSKYVMDNEMQRDLIMNSVLDWILNAGISIFGREEYMDYVKICCGMYASSMTHEPNEFDLNRISERNELLNRDLEKLDLSSITERYREVLSKWSCRDLANGDMRKAIVESYRITLPSTEYHSVFEKNPASFSNFYHLFESVFNATLLTYRDRGLIYHSLMSVLCPRGGLQRR
ncbi:MAG: nucleotidyltransferase domain-containing protein [Bacteroidetes bacterium]|nr:nucleotidyltransferase domain-containing protein [Bacteroidota bacterium]MBS1941030.1 nucleotidyltransferase domain-containing protein [Bacteroidota bacterium]